MLSPGCIWIENEWWFHREISFYLLAHTISLIHQFMNESIYPRYSDSTHCLMNLVLYLRKIHTRIMLIWQASPVSNA